MYHTFSISLRDNVVFVELLSCFVFMIECLCKQLTEIWWWPCQKHRNFHKNMTKLVFCCSSPAYLGFSHCRGNFSRHVITPTKFNRVHHAWFVTECPFSLLLCRTMYVLQDSKVMRLCDLLVLFLHFQCTIVIDPTKVLFDQFDLNTPTW